MATPPAIAEPTREGANGNGAPAARRNRFMADDHPHERPASDLEPPVPDGPKRLTWRERKRLGRLRARKVRRVIRHLDPWSVLKVSLLFYLCLFVVLMVSGVVLWNLASAAGTISDIEGFFKSAGAFETFSFDGFTIFRASALIGLILVIAGTAVNVLLAVLFNLISDLVGGVRVTVIEEETARPIGSGRGTHAR
jgi:hypothetical protein